MIADLNEPGEAAMEEILDYTVLPGSSDPEFPSRRVTKIRAESEEGWYSWLLTFDRERIALLRVEQIFEGGGHLVLDNPFGEEPLSAGSWMQDIDRFGQSVVHDFPELSGVCGTTHAEPLLSGAPGFDQSLEITRVDGDPRLDVLFTRTDPATQLEHRTLIRWEAGEKWWSSATVSLGGDLVVTGRLVPYVARRRR